MTWRVTFEIIVLVQQRLSWLYYYSLFKNHSVLLGEICLYILFEEVLATIGGLMWCKFWRSGTSRTRDIYSAPKLNRWKPTSDWRCMSLIIMVSYFTIAQDRPKWFIYSATSMLCANPRCSHSACHRQGKLHPNSKAGTSKLPQLTTTSHSVKVDGLPSSNQDFLRKWMLWNCVGVWAGDQSVDPSLRSISHT